MIPLHKGLSNSPLPLSLESIRSASLTNDSWTDQGVTGSGCSMGVLAFVISRRTKLPEKPPAMVRIRYLPICRRHHGNSILEVVACQPLVCPSVNLRSGAFWVARRKLVPICGQVVHPN